MANTKRGQRPAATRERIKPRNVLDLPDPQQDVPPIKFTSADYGDEKRKPDWGKWAVIVAIVLGVPGIAFLLFESGGEWNQVKNDITQLQTDDGQSKKDINDMKTDLGKVHGQIAHLKQPAASQPSDTANSDQKKPQ